MSDRTLIRGGSILTLGSRTPNYAKADVLIDDGRVAEVGPGLRARHAEVVDASNCIVMPGFVDAHRHAWKSLFKNLDLVDETLLTSDGLAEHFTADDVYAATLLGLVGAIEAGATTVVDWLDSQHDRKFVEAALQAHADSGVRTVFVRTGSAGNIAPGPLTTLAFGHTGALGEPVNFAEKWSKARESGLRIHAHAGVSSSEAESVRAISDHGYLREDVSLVHCTNLARADFDAIGSSGASVILTPSYEMAESLGPPPVQTLLDSSISPGLGVGDDRVAPNDLFAQMRATISLQHATYFDLKLAGKGGLPNLLRTRDVIRYATIEGARASGVADITGSLEAGKRADVIVLRADSPNIAPVNDPIGAVVWGMDTSNLDWVFVEGRPLMREGVLTADVENVRNLAVKAQRHLAEAAGLLIAVGDSE